jgi:hypothetical protein
MRECREIVFMEKKGMVDLIENKMINVAEEISKLQVVATSQHQTSEEMGNYLGSLIGERPAEGKAIKGCFEHFLSEINVLKVAVERLRSLSSTVASSSGSSAPVTTGAQPFAVEQLMEQVATLNVRIASVAGASQATEANLNIVQGQVNSLAASLANGSGGSGSASDAQAQEIVNMKTQLELMTAGNRYEGSCHCIHVTYLNDRLIELEEVVKKLRTPSAVTPGFAPGFGSQPPGGVHGGLAPHADEATRAETPGIWNMFSPLRERSLGMIAGAAPYNNIMDDKLMANTDYMYDGTKGSKAWQKLLGGYLISKVPAALDILKWAERHDQVSVSDAAFMSVAKISYRNPVDPLTVSAFSAAAMSGGV